MSLKDALSLWRTAREVALFEKDQQRFIRTRFYTDPLFRKIDRLLRRAYLLENPYRISRKYWGESSYGETPLSVLNLLGIKLRLRPSDSFIDLGCGRGRGVFFLSQFFRCKAVGIESVPSFVKKAEKIKNKLGIDNVTFLEKDLNLLDPIEGTVFYAAWTCFEKDLIDKITRFFENLPSGAKVVTVSEPIQSPQYSVIETMKASFAWGEGEIYIHERT